MRKVPQFRVAVNSRCGRACYFCRPSGEALPTKAGVEIDPAVVWAVAEIFVREGGSFLKLTGGDPALWEPLVSCVRTLKEVVRVPRVHVISRNPRIGDLAPRLASAGIDLLNISLDTLDQELHREITGVNDLSEVLAALERCVASGVPVKVSTVVMAGLNADEVPRLIKFCEGVGVKSIKLMDTIADLEAGPENHTRRLRLQRGKTLRDLYQPMDAVLKSLEQRAVQTRIVNQGDLGHPMLGLSMPSGLEVVVKDHRAGAWYGSICQDCRYYPCHDALMALRLTADLRLQFCLLREDIAIDLSPYTSSNGGRLRHIVADALRIYDRAAFRTKRN